MLSLHYQLFLYHVSRLCHANQLLYCGYYWRWGICWRSLSMCRKNFTRRSLSWPWLPLRPPSLVLLCPSWILIPSAISQVYVLLSCYYPLVGYILFVMASTLLLPSDKEMGRSSLNLKDKEKKHSSISFASSKDLYVFPSFFCTSLKSSRSTIRLITISTHYWASPTFSTR